MRYLIPAGLLMVLTVTVAMAAGEMGNTGAGKTSSGSMAAMCARESGLCGLETRALSKGSVLLGYTRAKGTTPTDLHVHVFMLSEKPDRHARVRAFMFTPGDAEHGTKLDLMRHGPGEYKVPITWDMKQEKELAVRVMRRGMKDEVIYFKLQPGLAPETR